MEGFGLLRRFFCALLALTLCILFAAPARGEGVSDFIRLHVVASGDTDWEQAVKLAVRDACLARAREVAADCADADAAYAALNANLAAFQSAATIAAREMGFDGEGNGGNGRVRLSDRVYGALFVPAGDYRALRVTSVGAAATTGGACSIPPCVWWTRRRTMPGKRRPSSSIPAWGRFLRDLFGGQA